MPKKLSDLLRPGDRVFLHPDTFRSYASNRYDPRPVSIERYLPDVDMYLLTEKRGGYSTWKREDLVLHRRKESKE